MANAASTRIRYVEPEPYWRIHEEFGEAIDLSEAQMLKVVNAFLSRHLLGEVIEDWTVVGPTYRYKSRSEQLREEKEQK